MITQMCLFDNLWPDEVTNVSNLLKEYETNKFEDDYSIWSHCPNLGYRYEAHFRCKENVAEEIGNMVTSLDTKANVFSMYYSYLPWLDNEYPYICHVYSIERRCKNGKL